MEIVESPPGKVAPPPKPAAQPLELQPPAQTFTCKVCIEPTDFTATQQTVKIRNKNCGPHQICDDCMIKYIQAKLDDNVSRIPCPDLNSPEFLDPNDYRVLVGPMAFLRWSDALCESTLVGTERIYCLHCQDLIVNECGGTVKKAKCPNCKKFFCFKCKIPWHAGFRCEESGELRDGNDRAFGVLAERKNWKRCPGCLHFVELVAGCRIVKCRCGARFCYGCGRDWNLGCQCDRIPAVEQNQGSNFRRNARECLVVSVIILLLASTTVTILGSA
ncbi:OLC1v1016705C1 [Oldenlandia corymbosa var. corymbosa]|uniref:RBR-type E3 ubiquitin transferase n=1 Tax=Oldenlandia corymbosa var. corymbosa TaxID=529605 RepID=A0AAV1E7S2_OLDCO|nr:OLC1v1016705C1 [Oldenlandia corymbosa var. corymbosa]